MKILIHWFLVILTALWILFLMSGCANTKFIVCGLDVEYMTAENYGMTVLGAVTSLGTHIAGHYIAAEACGIEFEQKGLMEVIEDPSQYSKDNLQWFARGGFVLQSGINLLLTHFAKDSYFTKGFTGFTFVELLTYPARRSDSGDFVMLGDNGGRAGVEYGLYTAIAGYNFLQVSLE